jgi:hypothetical protein
MRVIERAGVEPRERITSPVTCNWCGATWSDDYPQLPGDLVWCGECDRDKLEAQLFSGRKEGFSRY